MAKKKLKKQDERQKKIFQILEELTLKHHDIAREQEKADLQLKETRKVLEESGRKVDRRLSELGKQIGGLGEKFGGFTEGMALPSMEKVLRNQFGMDVVSPRTKVQKDGKFMELDVLAYSNSTVNAVYIVEIKSNLVRKGIDQMMRILEEFQFFFPEHSNKTLYGVLAIVDGHQDLQNEVLEKGIYLAKISDETFTLNIPKDFRPIAYPHTH